MQIARTLAQKMHLALHVRSYSRGDRAEVAPAPLGELPATKEGYEVSRKRDWEKPATIATLIIGAAGIALQIWIAAGGHL